MDILYVFKGPLKKGLRQFLATESSLRMMKNACYFMLKALFVLAMFTLSSWLFGYAEKRLDQIAMVNFKIHDVTDWTRNNYNTHVTQ